MVCVTAMRIALGLVIAVQMFARSAQSSLTVMGAKPQPRRVGQQKKVEKLPSREKKCLQREANNPQKRVEPPPRRAAKQPSCGVSWSRPSKRTVLPAILGVFSPRSQQPM